MEIKVFNPEIQLNLKEQSLQKGLHAVLETYQTRGIDTRLMGSLGRYASLKQNPPSIEAFNNSGIKDIDLVIMSPIENQLRTQLLTEAQEKAYPCIVEDDTFRGGIFTKEGNTYIRYKDLIEQVDPKVFEPIEGKIFGIKVPTFDPQTHFHLVALKGMRYKDKNNLYEYGKLIKDAKDILPEELFEPFHRLYRQQKHKYPLDITVRKVQYLYQKHVDPSIQQNLKQVTIPARKILKQEWWRK